MKDRLTLSMSMAAATIACATLTHTETYITPVDANTQGKADLDIRGNCQRRRPEAGNRDRRPQDQGATPCAKALSGSIAPASVAGRSQTDYRRQRIPHGHRVEDIPAGRCQRIGGPPLYLAGGCVLRQLRQTADFGCRAGKQIYTEGVQSGEFFRTASRLQRCNRWSI